MEFNKIYNEDCLKGMGQLDSDSIDLIVTSPPYNVSKNYDTYSDNLPYKDYLSWVRNWLSESFRVLKEGGRICVNVPLEINLGKKQEDGGKKYISTDYINIFEDIGFVKNSLVVWNKQNATSRTAWGSWMSPSCPNIIQPIETIIIYSKKTRKKIGNKENIDITRDEFIEYSLGVWNFGAESAKKIGHPSPFPTELPYRCIKMFSYVGDVILDPFMGSGTTAITALTTNRKYVGFEMDEKYYNDSLIRINKHTA